MIDERLHIGAFFLPYKIYWWINCKIAIHNLQGKIVLEKEIENTKPINIQAFNAGLYFYSFQ